MKLGLSESIEILMKNVKITERFLEMGGKLTPEAIMEMEATKVLLAFTYDVIEMAYEQSKSDED